MSALLKLWNNFQVTSLPVPRLDYTPTGQMSSEKPQTGNILMLVNL